MRREPLEAITARLSERPAHARGGRDRRPPAPSPNLDTCIGSAGGRSNAPDTLYFCDPPYYGDAGDWFWAFSPQGHEDLARMLSDVAGKAMVTYYDHPEIRLLYSGWTIVEHHRRRRGAALWGRPAHQVCELIITNYDPPEA